MLLAHAHTLLYADWSERVFEQTYYIFAHFLAARVLNAGIMASALVLDNACLLVDNDQGRGWGVHCIYSTLLHIHILGCEGYTCYSQLYFQIEFRVEEIMYETYMANGEESTKYQELVEGRAEHARKLLECTCTLN